MPLRIRLGLERQPCWNVYCVRAVCVHQVFAIFGKRLFQVVRKYFIVVGDEKQGPYTLSELENLEITPQTLVWSEGMNEWTQAKEVNEFRLFFEGVPPPIPNQSKSPNHNVEYFLQEQKSKKGPFTLQQLKSLRIDPKSNVWDSQTSRWRTASSIEELQNNLAPENLKVFSKRHETVLWCLAIIMPVIAFLGSLHGWITYETTNDKNRFSDIAVFSLIWFNILLIYTYWSY